MVETKNKIVQSAIALWGKDISCSLDDIANNVGVSRRTLHRHFSGKEDLIISVFDFIIEEYLNEVQSILNSSLTTVEKLKSFLVFDIKSGKNYMFFCQLRKTKYQKLEKGNDAFQALHNLYLGLFKQLKEEGKIDNGLSLSWIEIFYLSIVESANKGIESGFEEEECMAMSWLTFWKGIKK